MTRRGDAYPSSRYADFSDDDQDRGNYSGEEEPLPTGRSMGRRAQPTSASRYDPDEETSMPTNRRGGRQTQPSGAREQTSRGGGGDNQLQRRRRQPLVDLSDGEYPSPAGRRTAPQAQPSRRPRQLMIEGSADEPQNQQPRRRSNINPGSNEPAARSRQGRGETAAAQDSIADHEETQYTRPLAIQAPPPPQPSEGRHSTHTPHPPNLPPRIQISHTPSQLHLHIFSYGQRHGCPCSGLLPSTHLLTVIDCGHLYTEPRSYMGFHPDVTGLNPRYADFFFTHPYNEGFFCEEMRMVEDFVRRREGVDERWAIFVASWEGRRSSVVVAEEMGRVLRRGASRGVVVSVEHLDL